MYVSIYACMYTYIYMDVRSPEALHDSMYVCMYVCMHMCVCMYVRLPEILRDDAGAQDLFVYVCVSKYVRMYIACMYMCAD